MPPELLSYLARYFASRNPAELSRDILDLFITYYIFYRVALVLRGTRAMQVGVGLALVFILYVIAQFLHLQTVLTLLSAVLSSAILIGVVVFQNDIRRGLMRVGARARFGTAAQNLEQKVIDGVVEAATTLARHRIGALITFEQEANLEEFVGSHTGFRVDAAVSPELLVSLFIPEGMNKLHDGAVVIRDLRIAKAGVFFPMPEGRVKDGSFGSRHRAAMGITEETDAVVIVVSEERGSISFCFNGNIVPNLDGPGLKAALEGVFAPKRKTKQKGWFARLRGAKSPASERISRTPRPSRVSLVTPPSTHAPDTASTKPLRKLKDGRDSVTETPQPLRKRPPPTSEEGVPSERPSQKPPAPEPLRKRKSTTTDATASEGKAASEPIPSEGKGESPSGEVPEPEAPSSRKTLASARPMPRADLPGSEESSNRGSDGGNQPQGDAP